MPLVDENEKIKVGELAPEPFKITEIFNIPFEVEALRTTHKETTEWLWRLNRVGSKLNQSKLDKKVKKIREEKVNLWGKN